MIDEMPSMMVELLLNECGWLHQSTTVLSLCPSQYRNGEGRSVVEVSRECVL